MQHNGWDHALKVAGGGTGLVGHAGAILLRKAADQAGLTAGLSTALQRAGKSPLFDRGAALVSMAAAIALGATSMSDIAVLAHLAPVLGAAPGGPTIRRALDLAGTPALLERIAKARAKARAHVWELIGETTSGFPWLVIAGKTHRIIRVQGGSEQPVKRKGVAVHVRGLFEVDVTGQGLDGHHGGIGWLGKSRPVGP